MPAQRDLNLIACDLHHIHSQALRGSARRGELADRSGVPGRTRVPGAKRHPADRAHRGGARSSAAIPSTAPWGIAGSRAVRDRKCSSAPVPDVARAGGPRSAHRPRTGVAHAASERAQTPGRVAASASAPGSSSRARRHRHAARRASRTSVARPRAAPRACRCPVARPRRCSSAQPVRSKHAALPPRRLVSALSEPRHHVRQRGEVRELLLRWLRQRALKPDRAVAGEDDPSPDRVVAPCRRLSDGIKRRGLDAGRGEPLARGPPAQRHLGRRARRRWRGVQVNGHVPGAELTRRVLVQRAKEIKLHDAVPFPGLVNRHHFHLGYPRSLRRTRKVSWARPE